MSLSNATALNSESISGVGARINSSFSGQRSDNIRLRSANTGPGLAISNTAALELIRRHGVLGLLTEQERHMVLMMAKVRYAKRRHPIWHQGDHAGAVVLVLEGYVKLWEPSADGGEVLLEIIGPGRTVGEISVLQETPRDSNLRA